MNLSTSSLEQFIDNHYINMATTSQAEGLADHYSTPSASPSHKKAKGISQVSDVPAFDPIEVDTVLDDEEQNIQASVLNTVSSWMGEMRQSMQDTFNTQFDQALKDLRTELFQYVDSQDPTSSLSYASKDIDDCVQENTELQNKCRVLEGRLTRAEKEVDELRERILDQEARSMRDNIKFFNVPEVHNEPCETTVRRFLCNEMRVSDEDQRRIRFDRVHRTGIAGAGQHRVIVAKCNPSEGKHIIFSHIKNLDKYKKFGVSEQLPREMAERKKQLIPDYRQAKQDKKDVKWSVDKLIISGVVKEVKKDKVRDINVNTTEKAVTLQHEIRHSPPQTHQGSSFQGHSLKITSQDDIIPALHAIYSDSRVARATHNIYAYRLKSSDRYIEHYEDDGEWGAGAKLLDMLRDNNIENSLVCVTRWYGGTHLGKARFNHIINAAKESLRL